MKRKFTSLLMLAVTVISVGFLASCKDYDEDNYAKLEAENATLSQYYKTLNDQLKTLQDELKNKSCGCDATLTSTLKDLLEKIQAKDPNCASTLSDIISDYNNGNFVSKSDFDALVAKVNALSTYDDTELKGLIEAVKTSLTTNYYTKSEIDNSITTINNTLNSKVDNATYTKAISDINDSLTSVYGRLAAVETLSANNKDSIDALKKTVVDIQGEIAGVNNHLNIVADSVQTVYQQVLLNASAIKTLTDTLSNYATIAQLKDSISSLRSELNNVIDQRANALQQKIDAMYTNSQIDAKLSDLRTAYEAADTLLQNQIDGLNTRVGALEGDVTTLKQQVQSILGDITKLQNALASQVTGIIIQQVYNPAIGSFNTPVNVNTNILVAYYGPKVTDPDLAGTNWHGVTLPDEGATVIGGTGNAGKMYLTINPNTVDFTGLKLSLVNSQDEECAIKLGTPVKSDETLTFGYTRAADNGFYEVPATLSAKDVENGNLHLTVDKSAVKDALKDNVNALIDLAKNHDAAAKAEAKTAINDMASVIFKTAQGLELDAQGVQCKWSDSYGEHKVYSNYGVAAVAVKPFGFETENSVKTELGLPLNHMSHYDDCIEFLEKCYNKAVDKVIDQINKKFITDALKEDVHITVARIEKLDSITHRTDTITIHFTYDQAVTDKNGRVLIPAGTESILQFPITDFDQIIDPANKNFDAIADFIDDVNDIIENIDDMEEKAQNGTYFNKLVKYFNKYIDKYVVKAENKIPTLFHLAMLANSDNGFGICGHSAHANVVKGTVTLYPTTFTAELLTPLYKKYVKVQNAATGAVVYDGLVDGKEITLSGLAAGKYNVTYSALDYYLVEKTASYSFKVK